MSIVEGITLGIAVLGAVLGIINTWHAIDTRRVKLKVVPKRAEFHPSNKKSVCIEVINLSDFPVTIDEVGFLLRGTRLRARILWPITFDDGGFPRRLEAHSSFTGHSPQLADDPATLSKVKCAYARTQCGITQKGNSGALKSMIETAIEFMRHPVKN